MNVVGFIIFEILLFVMSHAQENEYQLSWSPKEIQALKTTEVFCERSTVSLEKHPYHAVVIFNCPEHHRHHGIIISDKFVLAATDPYILAKIKRCTHTVLVNANTEDNRLVEHRSEMTIDGAVTLFHLLSPINLGPRAHPIQMVKVDEGPKSRDHATITGLAYEPSDNVIGGISRKIYVADVNIMSEDDCKGLVLTWDPLNVNGCEGSFWIASSRLDCSYSVDPAVLNTRGQLIGIMDYKVSFGLGPGQNIDSFLDVARHRATIANYTGI